MTIVAVGPHPRCRCWPDERAESWEILELSDALGRVWSTDAHLLTCVRRGGDGAMLRPKRATVDDWLTTMGGELWSEVVMADIDLVGDDGKKTGWDDGHREAFNMLWSEAQILRTCGVYETKHGFRLVQPIRPVPSLQDHAGIVWGWLSGVSAALSQYGFTVDMHPRAWNSLFRLPHVRREGLCYQSPLLDLTRMTEVILEPGEVKRRPHRRTRPRPTMGRNTTASEVGVAALNEFSEDDTEALVSACLEVKDGRHDLFMCISGALLSGGYGLDSVSKLVQLTAVRVRPHAVEDSVRCVESTAELYAGGMVVRGEAALHRNWPKVHEAIGRILRRQVRVAEGVTTSSVRSDNGGSSGSICGEARLSSIEARRAATARIEEAIRSAPLGVSLGGTECGLGKTRAAIVVAAERALHGEKTAISVDKHRLAIEVANDLEERNVSVRRLYGHLSVVGANGAPVCIHADRARWLALGGQSIEYEFCEGRGRSRCVAYDGCKARGGGTGDEKSLVWVGTHAMLGTLGGHAGAKGLLIIDEPPSALESITMGRADVVSALRARPDFVDTFCADTEWAATALTADAGVGDSESVLPRIRTSEDRVSHPVRWSAMALARGSSSSTYAKTLGESARLWGAIERAMRCDTAEVRRRSDGGATVVLENERYVKALRREGRCIVLDAGIETRLPEIEGIIGYLPPCIRIAAPDGAPVRRIWVRTKTASRRGWGVGADELAPAFWRALRCACGLVVEDAGRGMSAPALIVSFKSIVDRVDVKSECSSWWGTNVAYGHYGAMRGINAYRACDAVVTLGDPRPNVGVVADECRLLDVDEAGRAEALAAAELEQAHGRIRAVQRDSGAVAVHVGAIRPFGTGWLTCEEADLRDWEWHLEKIGRS